MSDGSLRGWRTLGGALRPPPGVLRRITAAQRLALQAAADAGGRLWCAPERAGLLPRCRWNVALGLEHLGLVAIAASQDRSRVVEWTVTDAGWAVVDRWAADAAAARDASQ